MKAGKRPSVTSAPASKLGRFSRVGAVARALLIFYVLFYALVVVGTYGWLTMAAPVALPRGAALSFSTTPFGVALETPEARIDIGKGFGDGKPLVLQNVQHVWPLFTPWEMQTSAASAALRWQHTESADHLDGHDVRLIARLPFALTLTAGSIDWRSLKQSVKVEGEADPDPTTFVAPRFTYSENVLGRLLPPDLVPFSGAMQTAAFSVSPIMLPTTAFSSVVQVDSLKFRLTSSRPLPGSTERAAVASWRDANGRLNLEDFSLSTIGIDVLLAGDVGLGDTLDLNGNMQMQVSGIGDGYVRLGQLNIVPPQQYRLLGYLLQAAPEAGSKTFTMPVKIEKNKVYIGPAAAFSFGIFPWQLTDTLLNTPVAPAAAPPQQPPAPQMTPAPAN